MDFEKSLADLNAQQRLAVENIEGPVMVIAGPGTGKTRILALRIGFILKNTDTPPGSILCLTYTDAAATEMRHRLIEYIGPEAYRVQVNTFHGFCNLVIQENPSIFQQARELEPISDIEKFRVMQSLIDDFGPDHPLKRFKGNRYHDWKRLEELFATMKKENWSPAYMEEKINEYIQQKRDSGEFVYKRKTGEFLKGDFNQNAFRREVLQKMEPLKAAVAEYDHYNALLAERGLYDFDDMLLWVYQAFKRQPDLLANYQERFLYFLVDEFQDTNGIQIDILQKLIDHEWLERPNVFVVGDDDQAIYRFQGANIENLIQFHKKYLPEVIFLNQNYRSSQRILDASRLLLQTVDHSLMREIFHQDKTLEASSDHARHPQQVIAQSYPSLSAENADIFHQLKTWHEHSPGGSVAVLYPKHEHGRELGQALRGDGISYHSVRNQDALHHPLILHLIDILSCIHRLAEGISSDDARLYRILHLRYLEPRVTDLHRMMLAYTSKERTDPSTFFMWLGDDDQLNPLHIKDRSWIAGIHALLEKSVVEYYSRTLLSFTEWVIHAYGMMKWILQQEEKFSLLHTLKTFYRFVEMQSAGNSEFRAPDLLEICELMKTYNIRLPVHEPPQAIKGIYLSTLHGAKGLEFDKVIIKNLTDNEWEKKRPYSNTFSFPDNLLRKDNLPNSAHSGVDHEDHDRRRLLYVGMTRAKKYLLLTHAQTKEDGKGLIPSLYLTELEQHHPEIQKSTASMDPDLLSSYQAAFMSGEQFADLQKDDEIIHERVQNYVLNVSALNTYLECPVRFYYEKILMVPATETAPLLFGTSLHDAMQIFFRKRFYENDKSKSRDDLIDLFSWNMDRRRHRFTEKEFNDLNTYGRRILGQFYDHHSSRWSEEVRYELEYRIQDVHISGIPVKGFIDRVDRDGDRIVVIDYKSGNPDSISTKLKKPTDKEPSGGNYWRQMVFYDLLLRADPKIHRSMTAGFIQAIEPFKNGELLEKQVEVTDEDRQQVINQIEETYQKIQAMEFEKGCGECDWCRMHDISPRAMTDEDDIYQDTD